MGFLDKLEKFAEKFDEFSQKADKWLEDNTKPAKPTYSQDELLRYFVDNFNKRLYDAMLSRAKEKDSKVVRLDFSRIEFGKRTIQKCEGDIYHIEIKCSNIWGYNDYGSMQQSFVLSLNIFADEYAEIDYSKRNTVQINTSYEAQYGD